jgi:hypothetical protein
MVIMGAAHGMGVLLGKIDVWQPLSCPQEHHAMFFVE